MARSPEELLGALGKDTTEYANKATELSNLWEEIEARLTELPGKTACAIQIDESTFSFGKHGPNWRLLLKGKNSATALPVAQLPVAVKSRLAPYLSTLLEAMVAEQTKMNVELDQAVSHLRPFAGKGKKRLGDRKNA